MILFNKIPKIMQVLANEPRKDMHSFCKEFNTQKLSPCQNR
jgi:hypothetical protein